MRSLLSVSALVCLLLAAATSDALRVSGGAKFSSLEEEAANFASLSMNQYVERLEEALRHSGSNNQELLRHLNYYRSVGKNVKQSVRNTKKGTVHDCVDFDSQPALFEAHPEQIREARRQWLSATMGGLSSSKAVCHPGSLPVPRPVVKYAGKAFPKLSSPPQKKANTPKIEDPIPAGYSYVDSAFVNTSKGATFSYTILGVGEAVNSSIPSTPFLNDADHSINQMWWVHQGDASPTDLQTLEAGWIHSSYWSFLPETMLFVFSTPNGYQADTPKGAKENQYNYQGGFIGYPGGPALQQGVDSVQYMWKWEIIKGQTNNSVIGFAQKLTPFTVGSNGVYSFGTEIPLGYFPVGRYHNGLPPNFNVLQTGQEMSENANSTQLRAGGKIFGWGTNVERFNVLGNFTNFGQKMNFTYGSKPGFAPGASPYPADNWVAFHGDDCGKFCGPSKKL